MKNIGLGHSIRGRKCMKKTLEQRYEYRNKDKIFSCHNGHDILVEKVQHLLFIMI